MVDGICDLQCGLGGREVSAELQRAFAQRRERGRRRIGFAILAVAALALSACGAGNEDDSDTGSDDTGGTISVAPNFAFDHAASRGVPKDGEEPLDLSNIKCILNGSEPISAATVRRCCRPCTTPCCTMPVRIARCSTWAVSPTSPC